MRYKAEFDENSETNKFLDDLFREDCEIGWNCKTPQMNDMFNIDIVKSSDDAEDNYLYSLAGELVEKISEITTNAEQLPDERDKGILLTKEELISRMISISNQLDSIAKEIKEIVQPNGTITTIIGGGGCMNMF